MKRSKAERPKSRTHARLRAPCVRVVHIASARLHLVCLQKIGTLRGVQTSFQRILAVFASFFTVFSYFCMVFHRFQCDEKRLRPVSSCWQAISICLNIRNRIWTLKDTPGHDTSPKFYVLLRFFRSDPGRAFNFDAAIESKMRFHATWPQLRIGTQNMQKPEGLQEKERLYLVMRDTQNRCHILFKFHSFKFSNPHQMHV